MLAQYVRTYVVGAHATDWRLTDRDPGSSWGGGLLRASLLTGLGGCDDRSIPRQARLGRIRYSAVYGRSVQGSCGGLVERRRQEGEEEEVVISNDEDQNGAQRLLLG